MSRTYPNASSKITYRDIRVQILSDEMQDTLLLNRRNASVGLDGRASLCVVSGQIREQRQRERLTKESASGASCFCLNVHLPDQCSNPRILSKERWRPRSLYGHRFQRCNVSKLRRIYCDRQQVPGIRMPIGFNLDVARGNTYGS